MAKKSVKSVGSRAKSQDLGGLESANVNELVDERFSQLDEYLRGRLGEGSKKVVDDIKAAFVGVNNPLGIVESVHKIFTKFKDDGNLKSFADGVGGFIGRARVHAKKTRIKDISQHLDVIGDSLDKVGDPHKHLVCENIGLPLMRSFKTDMVGYAVAVEAAIDVPENKSTQWAVQNIYGSKPGEGIHNFLQSIPETTSAQKIVISAMQVVKKLSTPKRNVFLHVNGPEIMEQLSQVEREMRVSAWQQLLKSDKDAAKNLKLREYEFLRREGASILEKCKHKKGPEVIEGVVKVSVAAIAGLREKMTSVESLPHEPRIISDPDQLMDEDRGILQSEVKAAGGWVDVIVHPHASKRWMNESQTDFVGDFRSNTARTVGDYDVYQRHLNSFMKGGNRFKIVLSDIRTMDETRDWVAGLNLKNSVLIIPTMPSDMDNSATPRTSDMKLYMEQINRLWMGQGSEIPYEEELQKGDSWTPLTKVFTKLGVVGLRFAGEYAVSRLVDGNPTLDVEQNMNLVHGFCVEGARRNLLPRFDASILDSACFPHSPVLPPATGTLGTTEEISDKMTADIPQDIRASVKKLSGNYLWSLIAVRELYQDGGDQTGELDKFQDNVKKLGDHPTQNFNNLVSRSLLLGRELPIEERVQWINSNLEKMIELKDVAPSFALDPLTARKFDECENFSAFSKILSTASDRIVDIKSTFKGLTPHLDATTSRLLSPVRTDENKFYQETGRFQRLINRVEKNEIRVTGDKNKTVASLITYSEELRALVREGLLTGKTLYLEAGPDVMPLVALAREKPYTEPQKDEVLKTGKGLNPRFSWLSASEFELRYCLSLIKKMGFENPEDILGKPVTSTPLSRDLKNMIAVGRKIGAEMHIHHRLKQGYGDTQPIGRSIGHPDWENETRAIITENMDALPGHSTDLTPVVEHYAGTTPDQIIIKGLETWVYMDKKTSVMEPNSEEAHILYDNLDRITGLCAPKTKVLVASSDPNTQKYFREHPDFTEMQLPPNVKIAQNDYSDDVTNPVYVEPETYDVKIGDAKIVNPTDGLPDLLLIPKGKFSIFIRKGDKPRLTNIVDETAYKIVNLRGTEKYSEKLNQNLMHPQLHRRPRHSTKKHLQPTMYEMEEQAKTEIMFEKLLNKTLRKQDLAPNMRELKKISAELAKKLKEKSAESPDEILERGLKRHPTHWPRLRNLAKREHDKGGYVPSVRVKELRVLRHEVVTQTLIEEEYYKDSEIPVVETQFESKGERGKKTKKKKKSKTEQETEHKLQSADPSQTRLGLRERMAQEFGLDPDFFKY